MNKKALLLAFLAFLPLQSRSASTRITRQDRDRAAELISKMTLEEKCRLISGQIDRFHTYAIPRLGVRSVLFADATMGVRTLGEVETNSTCFPSAIASAASFNREVVRAAGVAVARDSKARGVGVLLGPGVNIYRSALCGRNFEYMGEDPYLAGELASEYIQGMQSEGVIATVKHFALNNQEYDRHITNSRADERTMNEIYFPAFRKAVEKGGVAAVMSSYNPVNGAHASENAQLLQNLRDWGFEGILMSDWTSTYTTIGCIESPLDMEFPGNQCFTPERIMPLLDRGIVTEAQIDLKCMHILQTLSAYGLLYKDIKDESIALDDPASRAGALKMAEESVVMLKNNGILPLRLPKKKATILVTGPNANRFVVGGGSSVVFPIGGRVVTLYQGLRDLAGKNCNVVCKEIPSEEEFRNADAVVFAIGFNDYLEKEGKDRKYSPFYKRDQTERSIHTAMASSDKVIVVVNAGGEVDFSGWADKAAAILYAWYPGQAGGTALAEMIYGKISPSGRLPFTFWGSEKANPTYNYYKNVEISPRPDARGRNPMVEYGEGIFVGYRGIEKFNTTPLYPFGYGLTYTDFEYSDLSAKASGDGFELSFKLTNKGSFEASEAAQVYVAPVNPSMPRPARELKEFAKVKLAKGASQTVTLSLPRDAFAHYDQNVHKWVVDPGTYKIQLGASATDIRQEVEVKL